MKSKQLKRMLSENIIALISIVSSSINLFNRLHSILLEHDLLLRNHKEMINGFSFNFHVITIQLTDRSITLINYPLIFALITLLINAAEGIYALIYNKRLKKTVH